MSGLLRCAWAFLVRDFRIEASYRLSFVLQFLGLFVSTLLWFFFAGFVDGVGQGSGRLAAQTGNLGFFPWVLAGITVSRFLDVSLSTFAAQIRNEQSLGTLEAMLVTPARLGHLMLASSSWSFVFAGMQAALYLLFGVFVFGVEVRVAGTLSSLVAVVLTIVLTIAAFSGIGILSAAFVLYFKRGNPINFVISSFSLLFGDVLVPARSLPGPLPWLTKIIPISYATNAVRGALLRGETLVELAPNLLALAAFAAVLLPIGLLGARLAVRRAKQEGTLVQY
ncbi:MAG: ABC transporter permease [Acidobacteria bacterium]|nr:MAG: ABC transporter permease [Acidobacteriota bacterium]